MLKFNTFLTIVLAVLGWLGVDKMQSIDRAQARIEQTMREEMVPRKEHDLRWQENARQLLQISADDARQYLQLSAEMADVRLRLTAVEQSQRGTK